MKYPYILMDADNTLFDFDKSQTHGLRVILPKYGVEATPKNAALYNQINTKYWDMFNRGQMEKSAILTGRFAEFFSHFTPNGNMDYEKINREYLHELSQKSFLTDGAYDMCKTLKQRGHSLYVVSNGTMAAQGNRYKDTGIDEYLSGIFLSDEMGVAKPDPNFFHMVFAALGNPPKSEIIILGDGLDTDIKGGKAANIATCFFNPKGKPADENCHYQIENLMDFLSIV